jgi:hypothetical protein
LAYLANAVLESSIAVSAVELASLEVEGRISDCDGDQDAIIGEESGEEFHCGRFVWVFIGGSNRKG